MLDYWSVIPRLLKGADGRTIQLRGCISVAGRAKPCLSSKNLAWQIPQGAWTARKDLREISPFTIIWRELFKANTKKHTSEEEGDGFPSYLLGVIVRTAMQKFPERPSVEEFIAALREADRQCESEHFQYAHLAFSMDKCFDRHNEHLSTWSFTPTTRSA